jgi:hypothetical protein
MVSATSWGHFPCTRWAAVASVGPPNLASWGAMQAAKWETRGSSAFANVNSHARYCDSFCHRSIIPCSARSLSSILSAQSFGPVPQFSVCFVPSTGFFFSTVLLRFHWRAGFTGDSKGRRPVLRCSASWLFAVAGERRANGRASHHASVAGYREAQCDGDNSPHSLDTSLMHPRLQAAGTLVYTGITKHTYQPSRMRSRRNFA